MFAQDAAELEGETDGAGNNGAPRLLRVHRVLRGKNHPAHRHRQVPDLPLVQHRVVRVEIHAAAGVVDRQCRARPHTLDREGHHLGFRQRARHAIAVDERYVPRGRADQRNHGIRAADLEGREVGDLAADMGLEAVDHLEALRADRQLLQADRRRADLPDRYDEGVVRKTGQRQQVDRAVLLQRLLHEDLADIGIAAATGRQEHGAGAQVGNIFVRDRDAHRASSCVPNDRSPTIFRTEA